eukprot:2771750-Prymnesium_polylepis.1
MSSTVRSSSTGAAVESKRIRLPTPLMVEELRRRILSCFTTCACAQVERVCVNGGVAIRARPPDPLHGRVRCPSGRSLPASDERRSGARRAR